MGKWLAQLWQTKDAALNHRNQILHLMMIDSGFLEPAVLHQLDCQM